MDTTELKSEAAKAEVKKKKLARAPRAKKAKVATDADQPATVEATVKAESATFTGTLGRRKTSVARVRLMADGTGKIKVNNKDLDAYFTTYELRNIVRSPLVMSGQETALNVTATVRGGGVRGQAEAVRLGITRGLVAINPAYRKTLKKLGYLMRDPRKKERKKPGLKRARRAPQWSKR